MFKRVEKKRKKREEEEELGLDDDMKEIMGLNDSDSDESDSGSESDRRTSDEEHVHPGDQGDGDEEEAGSEEIDEQPPMPVHEALKNPIYLISLDPTIYGCILCKGKLLKNAEMAVVHKDATAHKRRLERFKALASIADPDSDAWGIAKASQAQSALVDQPEPQTLSRRALKRQAKQATIKDKRKLHKQLKAKAIAKKASNKSSEGEAATTQAATLSTKTSGSPLPAKRPMKRQKIRQQLTSDPPDKSRENRPKAGPFKRVEKSGSSVSSKPHERPKSVHGGKRKRRP